MMPLLYRKVIISAPESALHKFETPLAKTYFKEDGSKDIFNCFQFANDLELVAPVCDRRKHRCQGNLGDCPIPTDLNMARVLHEVFMDVLDISFRNALFHLPDNSLKSFSYAASASLSGQALLIDNSWHLGCCIPSQILGSSGYLSSKQNQIRSLSLIFWDDCYESDIDGLPKLTELRSLSWKGIEPDDQRKVLQMVLEANSKHLENLDLGTISPDVPLRIKHLFVHDNTIKYYSLKNLCLSYISLGSGYKFLTSALRLNQLQSLKLRNCERTPQLLKSLASSNQDLKLKSFEMVYDNGILDKRNEISGPLILFLESFEGLEELYISMKTVVTPMMLFLKSILHHKQTLKRLVHHEREEENREDDDDEDDDKEDETSMYDYPLPWTRLAGYFLRKMALECVGFVEFPPFVVWLSLP
jgi:hypothetical protein